jgi:hypothetical protein
LQEGEKFVSAITRQKIRKKTAIANHQAECSFHLGCTPSEEILLAITRHLVSFQISLPSTIVAARVAALRRTESSSTQPRVA